MASVNAARLSMSRWLVGSSRMSRCGPENVAMPSSRRAFSPPERLATGVSAVAPENPMLPARARTLASGASGIRRETPRQQLRERRLAVAVRPEQRDAVVVVDPQRQPPQHRLARLVADRDSVKRDDRRRQRLCGRRKHDRANLVARDRDDRLHLGETLDARLRLPRLGRLGLEAIDERLQVLALGFLLFRMLGIERLLLGALARERRVAAAIEDELAAIDVQDPVDRVVKQVAVVADDDHGARIARE